VTVLAVYFVRNTKTTNTNFEVCGTVFCNFDCWKYPSICYYCH